MRAIKSFVGAVFVTGLLIAAVTVPWVGGVFLALLLFVALWVAVYACCDDETSARR